MITSTKELGERIRRERKRLGVTQSDLAMTAGTGVRFVVDLENGKSTVQTGKVLQILQTLGLQLEITSPGEDPA